MSSKLTDPISDVRSPSQQVVEAVAAATDSDPTEIGPLYHAIDPDALDHLFEATRSGEREDGYVQFSLAGCEVVVHGDGAVEVADEETGVESPSSDGASPRKPNSDGTRR